MTTERVDIVVTDKVSSEPAKKLRQIASEALKADKAVDRLKMAIADVDATALTRLANASAKLTNAQAREVSATARLENARARMIGETNKAALSSQRLASEQARTEAATERAAQAASRARSALIAEEAASLRLAAAKRREAAAQDTAASAANRAATASRRASRTAGLAAHQTQNLIFQVQDVVVGLASGQKPLTVMLQQGAQIQGVFGPGTGVIGILRGVVQATAAMVAPFLPVLAVVGVVAAGFGILTNEIAGTTDVAVGFGDVVKASIQLAAESISQFLAPAVAVIAPYFTAAYNFIIDATRTVVNSILGAFVGTYNAIKGLWGEDFPIIFEAAWKTAFNAYLSGIELVTRGVINIFSTQINAIVGLFTGGYNAVVNVWNLLPAAFERLGALAMNGLITVVETGVRGIIQALDSVLTFIGSAAELVGAQNPFADLLDPGNINLDEYRRAVAPVGPSISQTITDSFTEAFNRDYATGIRDAIDLSPYRQEISAEARGAADIIETAYRDAFSTDFAGGAFNAIRERSIEIARERIAAEEEANGTTGRGNAKLSTKQKLLNDIMQPLVDYRENTAALNELLAEGAITLGQYNEGLASLALVQGLRDVDSSLVGTPFAEEAAIDEIRVAEQERLNIVQQALEARIISEQEAADRIVAINRQAAVDMRAAHTASQSAILTGASDTFGSLAEAAKGFAGEQSAAYKVLFAASKAFAIADSIIKIQQGIANALALPFPANIPAIAAVAAQGASIIANIQAVAGLGFKQGGYTGDMGVNDVAGVVHGKEFVFDAAATSRIGVGNLERMRRGDDAPQQAYKADNSVSLGINVNVQNYGANKEFEVQQISETDVVIIARDVAKEVVQKETPSVVSAEMANPNSRVSRALGQNTNAQRRR